jgi:hypothetical protein
MSKADLATRMGQSQSKDDGLAYHSHNDYLVAE